MMVFSGFPLMCRCRGETRDRLREAEDLPERYRSSTDQLTSERVKRRSLGLLAEDDESLDHIASIHHEPLVFGWPIRRRWPAISSFAEAPFFAQNGRLWPDISGI